MEQLEAQEMMSGRGIIMGPEVSRSAEKKAQKVVDYGSPALNANIQYVMLAVSEERGM